MNTRITPNAVILLAGLMAFGMARAEAGLCGEFRALGWPGSDKLKQFALTTTLEGYFDNLDVDGDDIGDVVSLGCSASIRRADPCILEGKLSSGAVIELEAWYLYLIRHRGLIYAVTANEAGMDHQIFRVGPRAVELSCAAS